MRGLITALMAYDRKLNYINKLMTMEAKTMRKICADSDEAPSVVVGVEASVGWVGVDGELWMVVVVEGVVVVVVCSDSHASTIFPIASSMFCT